MRIPERDSTYIVLSVYLLTLFDRYPLNRKCLHGHKIDHTQVNLCQLRTYELELDFAEYIQQSHHTDMRNADLCWAPTYRLPGNVISATVALVYINVQPKYELSSTTSVGQFMKFRKIEVGGIDLSSHP